MKPHLLFIVLFSFLISEKLYSQQNHAERFPYIPYRYKNLWGYCDTLGNIIIKPQYDKAEFVNSTTNLPVVKNKKKAPLNENGTPILGFCDDYGYLSIIGGYWVLNNNKGGVVANGGDTILPLIYDKLFYANRTPAYQREENKLIGKIADQYYLISFANNPEFKTLQAKATSIPPLSVDRPSLWEFDPYETPPEREMLDPSKREGVYTLTAEKRTNVKNTNQLDSIEKNPFEVLFQNNTAEAFYKIYKNKKVGLWSNDHFIDPKYNSIQVADYYNKSFIASLDNTVGIISKEDKILVPFKYSRIQSTGSGLFITTSKNKQVVLMTGSTYSNIKNVYEKIELVGMLFVSNSWRFALFKVIKNGKEGFVGENGVEYFKD